jgi:hypothetical protein
MLTCFEERTDHALMYENKNNIIATVVAAFIISFIINAILLHVLIGPYLNETNRVVNIFNLYRNLEDFPQENIFFVGSSQIEAGIDSNLIENKIGAGLRAQVYNLGYPGDTPLRRLTEIARLSASHPRLVVIGLTYYAINDTSFNISADDLALVSGDIKLDEYSRSLFSAEEIGLIDMSPLYLKFYQRKFIIPSLLNMLRESETPEREAAKNFKALPINSENLTYELLLIRLNNSRDLLNKYAVSLGENTQKLALNYTIHLLHSQGFSVVIINMPLNPVLSGKISEDTRRNYFSYLNSTHLNYYDYERRYPSQCFSDLTHLNFLGRKAFSEDMARIINESAAL